MSETVELLGAGDRIELTFPARGDLIVLARLVTSAVSARAGFDIAISPNNRFLYTIIQDDETHFRLVRMNLLIRN